MKYEDMSMSEKLIYGMKELTEELELNCRDTNGDGDCPKCNTHYFMGFTQGLYESDFDCYYLKYDDKWYVWVSKWVCLNDKWPIVYESEQGLTTQDDDCKLTSNMNLVKQGCFNPEEYRLEMRLVND